MIERLKWTEVHFSSPIPRMSMFTLAISCLTTSNLPWFMGLTILVPMQYCSLQHRTLLPSTTGCCFHFDSAFSFFLEVFLYCSLLGNLRSSSFCVLSFCLFYCSWVSQGKNTEVVCHSFLQWTAFCQNSPPWPICLEWPFMAWLMVSSSQTKLWSMWSDWLVFCDCGFHSDCPLLEMVKSLMEASWWRYWLRG